jgi:ribosomal protein S18 acetylase RimI-like enzyme
MTPAVTLRPAGESDRPLLLRVFAGTRERELALLPGDAAARDAFLRLQFAAQERSYRAQTPEASCDVVLADGEPVGRLVVARRPGEIRLVDIALLPEHRGAGIGTALLARLLAEADAAGAVTTLHVGLGNRARGLYERLGFTEAGRDGVHAAMRRLPRQVNTAS